LRARRPTGFFITEDDYENLIDRKKLLKKYSHENICRNICLPPYITAGVGDTDK
jgi:hypothetical protein